MAEFKNTKSKLFAKLPSRNHQYKHRHCITNNRINQEQLNLPIFVEIDTIY